MPNERYNPYDLSALSSERGFVGDGASVGFWRAVRRNIWLGGSKGRASRSEFWYFWLFTVCCNLASSVLFLDVLDLKPVDTIIGAVLSLLSLAPMIRRLHDVNRSAWWVFLPLTIVGLIPLLIWLVRRGDPEPNRFDIRRRALPPIANDPSSSLEQVARLHQLRLDGAITEEEYRTLKARAL